MGNLQSFDSLFGSDKLKDRLKYYAHFVPKDEQKDFYATISNTGTVVSSARDLSEGVLFNSPPGYEESGPPVILEPFVIYLIKEGLKLKEFLETQSEGSTHLINLERRNLPVEENCLDSN